LDIEFLVLKSGYDVSLDKNVQPYLLNSKPYLLIQQKNKSEAEKFYLFEKQELKYFVSSDQYCVGHESLNGIWIPCPNRRYVGTENYFQCYTCMQDDFFSCRKICHGLECLPKSPRAKELCDPENTYLYLTFVAGVIKIGVSLNPVRRWLEQGSLYGIILYKGTGLKTRYFEKTLAKDLDLHLVVKNSDKIKNLGRKIPTENEIRMIFSKYIKKIIERDYFSIKNDFYLYNLISQYNSIPNLKYEPIEDNFIIKGSVVGIQGKLLVVKDKSTNYVCRLGKLSGKKLSTKKPENKITYIKQRSMFDY
jgi:hypothetical protein